jgi:hypothetical protein
MEDKQHPILRVMDALLDLVSPVFRFLFGPPPFEVQKPAQTAVPDDPDLTTVEREALIAALVEEVATNRARIRMLRAEHKALRNAVAEFRAQVLEAQWDADEEPGS